MASAINKIIENIERIESVLVENAYDTSEAVESTD